MTCTTVELLDKFITTGAGALQLRIPDEEEEPGNLMRTMTVWMKT